MKRINHYIIMSVALLALGLTSCDDYLDVLPDNRMELKNADELNKLLVSAYSQVHPAYLLEMYSDNSDEYNNTSWSDAGRFQEQAYRWQDITEISDDEAPQNLWDGYYSAVATANEVIKFVDEQPESERAQYAAQLGEALMCRSYAMFVLSNVFCMAYDPATASKEYGLPYPTEPETKVGTQYERGTLEDLYKQIDADLQRGLELVGDTYTEPKFHFTKNAAFAFAARFYLFYQKFDLAKTYADRVLGDNPAGKLRDWASWYALSANDQIQPEAYINSAEKANILLQVVYSQWGAICGPYRYGDKYAHGRLIATTETLQADAPWGSGTDLNYLVFNNPALSKYIVRTIPYEFEYTDLQAGIGYAHAEYPVFTMDETLMVRAEANALLGRYDAALSDINAELSKFHKMGRQLTLAEIKDFYSDAVTPYYTAEYPTPRKALNPSFALEAGTQEPLIQCVLHLRRLLTIHSGQRLQDVKRYGIKMYRRKLNGSHELQALTDSMSAGDPRLAIQLPQDVITAGLPANPR